MLIKAVQKSVRMTNSAISRLLMTQSHLSSHSYHTETVGSKYSKDFKAYLKLPNGEIGSFFHDLPINMNKREKTVQVVIEIPRWTNAKFEINKEAELNPISQDIKKDKLRYVKNLFPFKGYIHNYGAIPQTWDDPTVVDKETGFKGDNDPIDVCEIGSRVAQLGDVYQVKVLGSLALIDDGELDWKVIAIDVNDPLADKLNDIEDVKAQCPGLLESTFRWFKDYKIPDGKPANEFGYNGKFQNASKTMAVIEHSHQAWENLVHGKSALKKPQSIANITLPSTPGFQKSSPGAQLIAQGAKPDSPIPQDVDKVYYVA